MENPLVSIIVPVYNAASYVCECVDSILSQTYENIEILLINDGSKDDSDSVIVNHYGTESRITYINKTNEGVSKTRNYGIEKARGKYLTFVDADDWLEKTFIEEAIDGLEKYNLDFVLGGTEIVYLNGRKKYVANSTEEILIYRDDMHNFIAKVLSNGVVADPALNTCFTSGSVCKLYKRDVIAEIRFDESLNVGEDTVFNLKVMEQAKKVGVVPYIWYFYRMNNDSVTKVYNPAIVDHTERLLKVLMYMFYDNKQFRPYMIVRGVQQFHGMLLLYPLNQESKMGIFKQRDFIKKSLQKDIWRSLFKKDYIKELPARKFDRALIWLCAHRMYVAVILWVKIRLLAKNLLSKK